MRIDGRSHFAGTRQQQFGYDGVIADRFAILPDLSIAAFRNCSIQFQLTRDHRLREISFADEIRYHQHFFDRAISK